jgi:hypothetical protein
VDLEYYAHVLLRDFSHSPNNCLPQRHLGSQDVLMTSSSFIVVE